MKVLVSFFVKTGLIDTTKNNVDDIFVLGYNLPTTNALVSVKSVPFGGKHMGYTDLLNWTFLSSLIKAISFSKVLSLYFSWFFMFLIPIFSCTKVSSSWSKLYSPKVTLIFSFVNLQILNNKKKCIFVCVLRFSNI